MLPSVAALFVGLAGLRSFLFEEHRSRRSPGREKVRRLDARTGQAGRSGDPAGVRYRREVQVRKIGKVVPLVLASVLAVTAFAQDKKESQLRTVRGTVVAKQDDPIPSAVVYLKNLRTQTVKTYITDEAGHYRFSGLDPNVDYEIHAESK